MHIGSQKGYLAPMCSFGTLDLEKQPYGMRHTVAHARNKGKVHQEQQERR